MREISRQIVIPYSFCEGDEPAAVVGSGRIDKPALGDSRKSCLDVGSASRRVAVVPIVIVF